MPRGPGGRGGSGGRGAPPDRVDAPARRCAQSHCATAHVHVVVVVHVPAAAWSRPPLAPGTSRSSIMQPRLVDSSPMVVSCDRAHSECAAAEQVQVVVHVPAAALSRPRLAPGTSRSSIMQPRFVASFAIVVSFRYGVVATSVVAVRTVVVVTSRCAQTQFWRGKRYAQTLASRHRATILCRDR